MWLVRASSLLELGAAGVLTLVVSVTLGSSTISVPSVAAGGMAPVPAVALVTLLTVATLLRAWHRVPPTLAVTSNRPVWAFSAGQLLLLVVFYLLCALAVPGATGPLALARDLLGFIGLSVLAWRLAGRDVAIAAPAVALLLMCLLGRSGQSLRPMPWAWALWDPTTPVSWFLPVGLGALALILLGGLTSGDVRTAEDAPR